MLASLLLCLSLSYYACLPPVMPVSLLLCLPLSYHACVPSVMPGSSLLCQPLSCYASLFPVMPASFATYEMIQQEGLEHTLGSSYFKYKTRGY